MREVLIRKPQIKSDGFAGYSYGDMKLQNRIGRRFKSAQVNPSSHPKLVDLCSGKGAIAEMLIELGWNPENITCVDKYAYSNPFVEGVTWKYWDLEELASNLWHGKKVPLEVMRYQHSFDVVTIFTGWDINSDKARTAADFLVREGGIVYGDVLQNWNDLLVRDVIWRF